MAFTPSLRKTHRKIHAEAVEATTVNCTTLKLSDTPVSSVVPLAGTVITQTYATAAAVNPNITTTSPSATLVLTATNIASKTASLTLGQSSATNPTDAEFDQALHQ